MSTSSPEPAEPLQAQATPPPADEGLRGRLTASSVFLLLANLVPLYGVLQWGWSVSSVILLFWLENLIIGAVNVMRFMSASPQVISSSQRIVSTVFFIVHYGTFCLVHGLFVLTMFSKSFGIESGMLGVGDMLPIVERALQQDKLIWPLLGIAASHLFSFGINYIGGGEYQRTSDKQLMKLPYARVIVLHITIIMGGILIQVFDSPTASLVLLVCIKTAMDLVAHRREHAREMAATH